MAGMRNRRTPKMPPKPINMRPIRDAEPNSGAGAYPATSALPPSWKAMLQGVKLSALVFIRGATLVTPGLTSGLK